MTGHLERYNFPLSDVSSGAQQFTCWATTTEDGIVYYKLKEFAEALEYEDPKRAYKVIPDEWKITWAHLRHKMGPSEYHLVEPPNWHPETLMTTEAGIYSLLLRSNKPKAKVFAKFVCETILPTIRKTGRYDVRDVNVGASTSTAAAAYDKELAQAQMEAMRAKLELTESKLNVANLETKVAQMRLEWQRKEYEMRLQMKDMAMQANMSLEQFALNYHLADANLAQNCEMRQTLRSLTNRVVPDMTTTPHKKEWVSGYLYNNTVRGEEMLIVFRGQEQRRKIIDASIAKYARMRTGDEPRKRTMNPDLEWTDGAEKVFEFEVANSVQVWVRQRTENPAEFYGVEFVNKLKTEMRVMNAEQLREKYDRDRYGSVFEPESTFKTLGFVDFDDCRRRCMYEDIRAAVKVIETLLSRWVDSQRKKLSVGDDARTRENMDEWLKPEQVIHTMNNCTNYFIKNVFNIRMYDTESPRRPAIEPAPPPPPYSDV